MDLACSGYVGVLWDRTFSPITEANVLGVVKIKTLP